MLLDKVSVAGGGVMCRLDGQFSKERETLLESVAESTNIPAVPELAWMAAVGMESIDHHPPPPPPPLYSSMN